MKTSRIRSITVVEGLTDTYDITVKPNNQYSPNFVANGIVARNSGGIEPEFEHEYIRNVLVPTHTSKEAISVYSYSFYEYKKLNPDADSSNLPDYFATADSIPPNQHVDMQAAAQKWIDSSISKCIEVGTLILTDQGLLPIEEISNQTSWNEDEFSPAKEIKAYCPDGVFRPITSFYYAGIKDAIKVHFSNGFALTGSPVHRLMSTKGWLTLGDAKVGDEIVYRKTAVNPSQGCLPLPPCLMSQNLQDIVVPSYVSTTFCQFIGLYFRACVNDGQKIVMRAGQETIDRFIELSTQLFNIQPVVQLGSIATIINENLAYWLLELTHSNSRIPLSIIKGSVVEHLALIKTLNLHACCDTIRLANARSFSFDTYSLASDVFSIATSLGLNPSITSEVDNSRINYLVMLDELSAEFTTVKIIALEGVKAELCDIEVANSHDYLVSGIWSHNTINVPTNYPFEDFKDIYMYGYEKGLKGCTVFRFNPNFSSGVLVRKEDLANTKYKFNLKNGDSIEVTGDSYIEYDGQRHMASNLADAIKNGTLKTK